MVTTFFGPQSFGGDASYVDHLSRSLARRGHEVEVVHSPEAFRMLARQTPLRAWRPPPPGMRVRPLDGRVGWLGPLWTQQTGTPGPSGGALRRVFESGDFDVIHFHNVSLLGGPAALSAPGAATSTVRLMSLHDYWLVCPMHLLWKLGRRICERPECLRCTLHGRRPPQLWRRTGMLERGLDQLDALLAPSSSAVELHRSRGVRRPILQLPFHLPADWAAGEGLPGAATAPQPRRPYVAAAGRLVDEKGFDRLIEAMAAVPELDLRLAGAGPGEASLRGRASEHPNVELVGLVPPPRLAELFRGARAVVVPSRFPETFGYVAVEAFSVGTPAIVSDSGALPELIEASGAGIVFRTDLELVNAIRRLGADDRLRAELGARGLEAAATVWSEDAHLEAYLDLVERLSSARPSEPRPASSSS
jgi:glycosyltransferase involved in cell wall biosynthesis